MSQGTKLDTRKDTKMKQTSVLPTKMLNAGVEIKYFLENIYSSRKVDNYMNNYSIW